MSDEKKGSDKSPKGDSKPVEQTAVRPDLPSSERKVKLSRQDRNKNKKA